MAELIDKVELVKAVRESRKNNTHADGSIARNHDTEHCHFLSLISSMPTTTEAEIRAKAYTEIVEQLEFELSESIIWSMLADFSKDKTFDYTAEKIIDYVIITAKRVAEQLKGEMKDDGTGSN